MFYGRYLKEILLKHVNIVMTYLVYHQIYRRVMKESVPMVDNDVAMKPVDISELDHLELFTINQASKLLVEKAKQKAMRNMPEEGIGTIVRPGPADRRGVNIGDQV